jgi:voltage-gated potassium channel
LNLIQRKPLSPRRAAGIIALYTIAITFAGAVLVRITDRDDFHSFGAALWWALQTVTTVGYGDVVPSAGSGRVVGAIVMLSGIAFLTVITAAVTAALIEDARRRQRLRSHEGDLAARLESLEKAVDRLAERIDRSSP